MRNFGLRESLRLVELTKDAAVSFRVAENAERGAPRFAVRKEAADESDLSRNLVAHSPRLGRCIGARNAPPEGRRERGRQPGIPRNDRRFCAESLAACRYSRGDARGSFPGLR